MLVRADARQQHVHGAFAAGAQPEQLVGGAAHVVAHDPPNPGGGHGARVFAQVTFETTTGQQAGVFAIGRNQHLCTGFGVRGAAGADDGGQHQGLIQGTGALKQGQEAMQRHQGGIYARYSRRVLAR